MGVQGRTRAVLNLHLCVRRSGVLGVEMKTLPGNDGDLDMSIEDVVRLNSLMETEQAVEIGKLNEARNKIIEQNIYSIVGTYSSLSTMYMYC